MCTAISINASGKHLFGRTLDLERTPGEELCEVGCGFYYSEAEFRVERRILGVAHIYDGVPLFYDCVNEDGLAAAALNFPSAEYGDGGIPSRDLLPMTLSKCASALEAAKYLDGAAVCGVGFADVLPATPLHWIIADKRGAIIVEPCSGRLRVTPSSFGVMTNAPEISYHEKRVAEHLGVSPRTPKNSIAPSVNVDVFSRGLGGVGLPGDYSSVSRFVRGVFLKENAEMAPSPIASFFNIMDSLKIPRGAVVTDEGLGVGTVYTSCIDTDEGAYYFVTEGDRGVRRAKIGAAEHGAIKTYPVSHELFVREL